LHACLLQLRRIIRVVVEIVRPKLDRQAAGDEHLDEMPNGPGARIPVGLGYVVVDHQNGLATLAAILGEKNVVAVGEVLPLQRLPPALKKLAGVGYLMRLSTGRLVGTMRDSLMMDYNRVRLEVHLAASGAHAKGEIGILPIC